MGVSVKMFPGIFRRSNLKRLDTLEASTTMRNVKFNCSITLWGGSAVQASGLL
jgi:hypothetical protein